MRAAFSAGSRRVSMLEDGDETNTSAQITATCTRRTMIAMNSSGRLKTIGIMTGIYEYLLSVNAHKCPLLNRAKIDQIAVMRDHVQPRSTMLQLLLARVSSSCAFLNQPKPRSKASPLGPRSEWRDCSPAGHGGPQEARWKGRSREPARAPRSSRPLGGRLRRAGMRRVRQAAQAPGSHRTAQFSIDSDPIRRPSSFRRTGFPQDSITSGRARGGRVTYVRLSQPGGRSSGLSSSRLGLMQ